MMFKVKVATLAKVGKVADNKLFFEVNNTPYQDGRLRLRGLLTALSESLRPGRSERTLIKGIFV